MAANSTPVPRTEYVSCSGPECEKAAWRGDLCRGHYAQRRKGRSLSRIEARYLNAWERLVAAMQAYTDADTDAAFERAKARCRAAAKAFIRSLEAPPRLSCRQRRDGRWECRVRRGGKRLSFYGSTRAEARGRAVSTPSRT